ncbi:glycosyltransferase family 69 protein [Cercophora scortea]|uniref:Glycosyltransferase family 69 protein n=1 Tax=Cercophora scortea TaxID=314031 RepID=A0AAE0IXT7_9PEZI|nr:glycosyltransferase family 69 protein [Cercophora scortea]
MMVASLARWTRQLGTLRFGRLRHGPARGSEFKLSNGTLTRQNLTTYLLSSLDPTDNTLPKLQCPAPDLTRYQYLQQQLQPSTQPSQTTYFFALNLRNSLPLLPRLLGSTLEAIRFLGPAHCALSIVEGNSPDGTAEVLAALEPSLTRLGIRTHFILNNKIDPLAPQPGNDRFSSLATLRNLALAPLLSDPARYTNATVLFINDVAICPDDLLELIHQRRHQNADLACALDWVGDDPPVFYDSYIARAINGDLFFEIPPSPSGGVSWARATDLFWNEPIARARLAQHRPFQVFACWNGAVVFTAKPLVERKVAFRAARADKGECHAGEPQVFCKDMWVQGYGKIMVVPSVNLEYSNEKARAIKEHMGFASRWAAEEGKEGADEDRIQWLPPPEKVKCMPTFEQQSWRAWNESVG